MTNQNIELDARELLARAQQINPDLIARVIAEARADKLQEILNQQSNQMKIPEINDDVTEDAGLEGLDVA